MNYSTRNLHFAALLASMIKTAGVTRWRPRLQQDEQRPSKCVFVFENIPPDVLEKAHVAFHDVLELYLDSLKLLRDGIDDFMLQAQQRAGR